MTDATGTVLGTLRTDPFGFTESATGASPTFGFARLLSHAPSGLDLSRTRAYDPFTARWLSRDPIGEAGGVNLYQYVGNNPVNLTDQSGLQVLPSLLKVVQCAAKLLIGSGEAAEGVVAANELSFGRKLDFLFNQGIDQSNAYNAARAAGNAERIGLADNEANRAEVTRLFNKAYNDPSSIVGQGNIPNSNIRELFLPGVTGTGSKIQFIEVGGKVITIIAK
jgi:RHS repeat-associated protein